VDAAQLVLVEGMIGSGKTTTALRIGNCLGGRLVFTTRRGAPVEPRNFSRSFDGRIARAEVRRITLHGTRKTCGTLLAALDVHPRVAMQILRHSQTSVTMEIYTEATSEATRAALKRLGEELSPHTPAPFPTTRGRSNSRTDRLPLGDTVSLGTGLSCTSKP